MRSPHSAIPAVTIARSGDGWMVGCLCGFESYQTRRPGADRVAYLHIKTNHKENP